MKLKSMILAGTTAFTLSFGALSQAESFVGCVSTDMVDFDGSIVDAALETPELSTLVDALVAANLVDALSDAEDITVFAPTNDAFAAVPGGLLDAILADGDLLATVLTYHVAPGARDPRRWLTPRRINTLAGPAVFFHRQNGEARVNQSAVACQGVKTDNGTVWIIDSVLLP